MAPIEYIQSRHVQDGITSPIILPVKNYWLFISKWSLKFLLAVCIQFVDTYDAVQLVYEI